MQSRRVAFKNKKWQKKPKKKNLFLSPHLTRYGKEVATRGRIRDGRRCCTGAHVNSMALAYTVATVQGLWERTLEKGLAPMTLTGLPARSLQFQARLRSPFSSSCCLTFAAGSSSVPHVPVRLFLVRHVQASWFPSMISVGYGHSLICSGHPRWVRGIDTCVVQRPKVRNPGEPLTCLDEVVHGHMASCVLACCFHALGPRMCPRQEYTGEALGGLCDTDPHEFTCWTPLLMAAAGFSVCHGKSA